ncbi:GNAT family N-acetyltransferase [Streptomyces sp. Je 1-79]|uniref:GNAT family N-acetyltransferase n=1 Tax=Streptomyces sp. Je 1-79 TaxID=2943847 RepID=UPI0021A3263D|nr:GNAT family N-acetyltransferase [Streptomyces sp. Je 1-79]MCT4355364.1 GNAT family N-acetyltransferase [Streptomyces sp. Je 1-79]
MDYTIRAVRPEEYEALGEITARAFLDDGHLDFGEEDDYLHLLRDVARRVAEADVLVAVDRDGTVLGGVTFARGGEEWADIAREGEAEFRMLAVAKGARGRGVGEALVRTCVERARNTGEYRRMVLSTQSNMASAHRIYERLGFVRTPDRDWKPLPDMAPLFTYALEL